MATDSQGNPLERNNEDAQRILQSIRDAHKQADLVIVYEHNHIFDKPFGTIFSEELPERLVPPDVAQAMDARGSRCGRRYRRDAWLHP